MTIHEIRETIARKGNKRGAILKALQEGILLTVASANYVGATVDARKRISELRAMGYDIKSDKVKGQNYNYYWLVK